MRCPHELFNMNDTLSLIIADSSDSSQARSANCSEVTPMNTPGALVGTVSECVDITFFPANILIKLYGRNCIVYGPEGYQGGIRKQQILIQFLVWPRPCKNNICKTLCLDTLCVCNVTNYENTGILALACCCNHVLPRKTTNPRSHQYKL